VHRFAGLGLSLTLLLFLASVIVLPFAALLGHLGQWNLTETLSDPWIQRVVRFSVWQAFLSTALSVLLAMPVAIALSREQQFPARSWLLNLFSLSLVMPTLVAITGIVAVFGRTGWFNQALEALGAPTMPLYGLTGILIAHVFFNLPLATRIFLVALDGIPASQWRLASQLGIRGLARIKFLEWPAIRSQLVGTAILIFALCLTSFAIVLTLGGGPRATTIEVAIYQALRLDFDIGTAVSLALVQLGICLLVFWLGSIWKQDVPMAFTSANPNEAWRPKSQYRFIHALIILLALTFTVTPIAGLLYSAINLAISSASLAFLLAVGLLLIARHCHYRWHWVRTSHALRSLGNIVLVMPPLVLGTGLFLLLRPYADVFSLALLLVILINALLALPFVLRILEAPIQHLANKEDRLVSSLGVSGWARF